MDTRKGSLVTQPPCAKSAPSHVFAATEEVGGPTQSRLSLCPGTRSRMKPFSAVPGPRQLPLVGNAWRFLPLVGEFPVERLDAAMEELRRRFGSVVRVGGLLGHADLLFVFDADAVARVLRREDRDPHRPAMPSISLYKGQLRRHLFGRWPGLIGVHGEQWSRFRSQVQQPLLQAGSARRYVPALQDVAQDFIHRMEEMKDEKDELPDRFIEHLYTWALESVALVALDTRLGCLRDAPETCGIVRAIQEFFPLVSQVELRLPLWHFFSTPSWKRYLRALDSFTGLCGKHIAAAIARMGDDSPARCMEEESIVRKILRKNPDPQLATVLALDMLLVGVDTTSVAVASTMYQLCRHPEKQEKLFRELRNLMPRDDVRLDAAVIDKMAYLKACVKETLRMFPVIIGNGRSLQTDAVIQDYHVPRGTHVIFPHLSLSRTAAYFPRPDQFLPERWLPGGELLRRPGHQHACLPFGHGRRMCVGRRFAEAEMHILLAKIIRKYELQYHYGELEYKLHPTYMPDGPLRFKLKHRRENSPQL